MGQCNDLSYRIHHLWFSGDRVYHCLQMVAGMIANAAEDQGNAFADCLAKACLCCLSCWKDCLEFVSKNAYFDIAMNSTSFCEAGRHALEVLTSNLSTVVTLRGATTLFKISGL